MLEEKLQYSYYGVLFEIPNTSSVVSFPDYCHLQFLHVRDKKKWTVTKAWDQATGTAFTDSMLVFQCGGSLGRRLI